MQLPQRTLRTTQFTVPQPYAAFDPRKIEEIIALRVRHARQTRYRLGWIWPHSSFPLLTTLEAAVLFAVYYNNIKHQTVSTLALASSLKQDIAPRTLNLPVYWQRYSIVSSSTLVLLRVGPNPGSWRL